MNSLCCARGVGMSPALNLSPHALFNTIWFISRTSLTKETEQETREEERGETRGSLDALIIYESRRNNGESSLLWCKERVYVRVCQGETFPATVRWPRRPSRDPGLLSWQRVQTVQPVLVGLKVKGQRDAKQALLHRQWNNTDIQSIPIHTTITSNKNGLKIYCRLHRCDVWDYHNVIILLLVKSKSNFRDKIQIMINNVTSFRNSTHVLWRRVKTVPPRVHDPHMTPYEPFFIVRM